MEQTKTKIAPRVVGFLKKEENLIWTCMKTCLKCGGKKPLSEYHAKRGKPQPQCKACRKVYMAEHYRKNKERINVENKAWYERNKSTVCEKLRKEYASNPEKFIRARRRQKYGLTQEKYLEIINSQGNQCPMCERSFSEVQPHIDHCHSAGVVRGILCGQCNTGFGLFKEDEAILRRVIAYSRKYKK